MLGSVDISERKISLSISNMFSVSYPSGLYVSDTPNSQPDGFSHVGKHSIQFDTPPILVIDTCSVLKDFDRMLTTL